MMKTKTKHQLTLKNNTEDTLHGVVLSILPRFNPLYKNEQVYPSHEYVHLFLAS